MSWSAWGRIFLIILLLLASSGSVSAAPNVLDFVRLDGKNIQCGATADWASYFNGVLGGASLAVLIVMLIKMPVSIRRFFKKARAPDE